MAFAASRRVTHPPDVPSLTLSGPVHTPAVGPALDVDRLTIHATSLDGSRAAWTDLAARQDNVFSTWEWGQAWWSAYGAGRQALVHEVRDATGRAVGILPLYLAKKRPTHVLRFIGHGPADELGPVCAPADRARVTDAMQMLVRELGGPRGLLLAEGLRGDQGWEASLHGTVVRRQSFPLIELEGLTWETWLAARSANFRQQVRRRERRLDKANGLRFRLVRDEDERAAALRTLVGLHDARWAGTSTTFDRANLPMQEHFTRLAAEQGWLRLWIAELDGRPAAAWLGYRFGRTDAYYQMGRDPSRDDTSVGSVLLMHTLRDAMEADSTAYKMLRGAERYKGRLQSADPGVLTYVVGTGRAPALAAMLLHHRQRLPRRVRTALAGGLRW